MDTINIINNFDQKVLMENLLMLNQKKLLDLVIKVFKEDFKEKTLDDLSIEYVKNYFNGLNFINWELFIRLLNLKSTFIHEEKINIILNSSEIINYHYHSLYYLIREHKSTKLIEFLLELPKELIDWNVKTILTNSNILITFFSSPEIFTNLNLINKIIKSDLFDLKMWVEKNNNNLTALDHLIYFFSEEIIINFIELKKIKLNENQLKKIKSEKIILYLMEKQDITMDSDIFNLAIENNWINVIDYYFEHGLIEWNKIDGISVAFWLFYHKNYAYAKIAYFNSSKRFFTDLQKEYDMYNLNPYAFD